MRSVKRYCLNHFPPLVPLTYKLWKLYHPIYCYIGETQLNKHGTFEHDLICDVNILQYRAEQLMKDAVYSLTLKAHNMFRPIIMIQHYYSL